MKSFLLTLLITIAANAATISGTVTGDANQPLGAMTVDVYTAAGALQQSTSTQANGSYSLTVPNGAYRILAYDPAGAFATSFYAGADSFETSTTLNVTQNVTNINFQLVRAGFAVGRISPAPNMTVAAYNLSGTRRGFTTTNSSGDFILALPPGDYKLAAFDPAFGYATTFHPAADSFDSAAVVSIAATESTTVNITLPRAVKIAGLITDRTTNAPLAAMRVTAYASDGSIAARTTTASDGRYALAARAGALRVVVDDPAGNYATAFIPDAESFSVEEPVTTSAGQSVTINATLQRGGRIAGVVTPSVPVTVIAYNADGTIRAFTIANGAYSIVVPPGDYRIGAFDPALVYLPQTLPSTAHVIAQQTAGGFDFTLTPGARVTGHVTSRATGAPLAAITVAAYDLSGHLLASAQTDVAGAYTIVSSTAAVKLLAFDDALHYATAYYLDAPAFDETAPLPLIEGQTVTVDFALADAGRMTGTVTDIGTFTPLTGMQVFVYDTSFRTIAQTTTDAAGTFRIAVPAGTYSLAAADPAHRYASASYGSTINVAAGQDIGPFPIRLTPAAAPVHRRSARH